MLSPTHNMKIKFLVSFIGAAISFAVCTAGAATAGSQVGRVYVLSNKPENSVLVFDRASDGSLTFIQEAATQGAGTGATGDPLQSQGSVALRADNKILLAVNPASGELTAFRVTDAGLEFGSKVSSGGFFPVSVTVYSNLVYVVNQLGVPNINGYTVSDAGQLLEIASSTRDLAGGPLALPAEVSFTPDGTQLIAPNFIMQKTRSGRRTTGRSSPRHRATNRSARPTKSPSHPPAKLSRLRTAQFIAIPTAAAARSRLVWRITRSRS